MNDKDIVTFDSKPDLKSPYIICGLNGWLNSGDVSVAGINYFIEQFTSRSHERSTRFIFDFSRTLTN